MLLMSWIYSKPGEFTHIKHRCHAGEFNLEAMEYITLAVRLLDSGNLNLSGNQEMDFELTFLKSSKIGDCNIMCEENNGWWLF